MTGNQADEFARAEEAAQFVLARTSLRPRIGVILGSGLGAFADELHETTLIGFAEIPDFPRNTTIGHAGRLVIGTLDGLPLAVMQGRVHLYEGYSATEVVFPVRVLARMGVRAIVLTNAAGGINPNYDRGALVVVRDHINLQGANPLTGPNDDRLGPRFPDMSDAYNGQFRRFALAELERLGERTFEGVYAAVAGPSFETPAEIRFLRTIGADLVGMSTAPEVILARYHGLECAAVSLVTNFAAGLAGGDPSHEETTEYAAKGAAGFQKLLRAFIARYPSQGS